MKAISYLLFLIAIVLGVASVVGGVYVCVYQGWFLGIVGVVEAGKATPIESAKLAWSLIRVFLGSAMGCLAMWLGWLLAAAIFAVAGKFEKLAANASRAERDRRALLGNHRR